MEHIELAICVGSSCHLKGSRDVIEAMRGALEQKGLSSSVELKAAFCLGQCGHDGVTVKVGEKIIPGLTPEKIPAFLDSEVLPLLK
jgi:NADH:ubiquinone oxidoreductase subunit E